MLFAGLAVGLAYLAGGEDFETGVRWLGEPSPARRLFAGTGREPYIRWWTIECSLTICT